jgi:outer membrane beta-barrel protein
MRWLLVVIFAAVPALSFAQGSDALLDELEEQEERDLDVIQNRKYDLLHEVSLLAGGLPSDPYYFGLTGTLGYALHLNQFVAWEVVQFTYSQNFEKKLQKELKRTALASGTTAPLLPAIDWIVASHLVLKPLYGKEAVFNTEVLHLEAFLQLGPALIHTTDVDRELDFGVDLGAGLRLWLGEVISVRIDLGELIYFVPQAGGKQSEVKGALHLHLGVAFNLRGED